MEKIQGKISFLEKENNGYLFPRGKNPAWIISFLKEKNIEYTFLKKKIFDNRQAGSTPSGRGVPPSKLYITSLTMLPLP